MKEKERRKIKSEEKETRRRERSNGCTLSFYKGYFGRKKKKKEKKLLDAKGPFGGKNFKNPGRYIFSI